MKMGVSKVTYPFFLLVIHCLLRVHTIPLQYPYNTVITPLPLRTFADEGRAKRNRALADKNSVR